MSTRHTLYRFFDGDGALLYVGISMTPWERFRQHRHDKPWWDDITTITKENHPTREAVLEAEKHAIVTEGPRHNIQHNRSVTAGASKVKRKLRIGSSDPVYAFTSRRTGEMKSDTLRLIWEIDGMSMSDDYLPCDASAAELFGMWRRQYVNNLDRPMRIYWFVGGPRTKIEFASLTPDDYPDRPHWLRYYSAPMLLPELLPVSLRDLPVMNMRWSGVRADKGGFVQEHCGWQPYALRGWVTGYELVMAARRNRKAAV